MKLLGAILNLILAIIGFIIGTIGVITEDGEVIIMGMLMLLMAKE